MKIKGGRATVMDYKFPSATGSNREGGKEVKSKARISARGALVVVVPFVRMRRLNFSAKEKDEASPSRLGGWDPKMPSFSVLRG